MISLILPYITHMKQIALILALAFPLPLAAQETTGEDGPSLMERGAKLFFRGLMDEMDPALQGLQDLIEEAGPAMQSFLREMGPALVDLFDQVEDFANYHPPEMLPNGDIIMRRRSPLEDAPATGEDGEIDL